MPPDAVTLVGLYDGISAPPTGQGEQVFSATTIPGYDRYRLAKDYVGAPALLVRVDQRGSRQEPPPIRLQHLYVAHGLDCDIHRIDGSLESGQFTVVRCLNSDSSIIVYFLRILEALLPSFGRTPSPEGISKAVNQMVELFQAMQQVPRKATQGLWGELFVIAESADPGGLIDAWHASPEDLYDFNSGALRIEVKCASGQARVHHFSLAQLSPPAGTLLIVASVIVNRAGRGCSVAGLVETIASRLHASPERVLRLYQVVAATLGTSWRQATIDEFDLQQARHTLAFFNRDQIPSLSPDLPGGVSNVHFQSDLTGRTPMSNDGLRHLGGLSALLIRG